MLEFIKREYFTVVRMALFGLGSSLLGLMITFPMWALSDENQYKNLLIFIASAFAVCFYVALIYFIANDCGQKDKIRRDAGRIDIRISYYAVLGVIAQALNIVLAVLAIIARVCLNVPFFERMPDSEILLSEIAPVWAGNMYNLTRVPYMILNGMYLGINDLYFDHNPLFLLIYPLIGIAACTLGYAVGAKRGAFLPFGEIKERKPKAEK